MDALHGLHVTRRHTAGSSDCIRNDYCSQLVRIVIDSRLINFRLIASFLLKQFFVRLENIRKCFTQKGGIFVLEEFSEYFLTLTLFD